MLAEYVKQSVVGAEAGVISICRLACGIYVHIYDPTVVVACSSVSLSTACGMFTFDVPATTTIEFTGKPSIDVQSYTYSNDDLCLLSNDSTSQEVVRPRRGGKYTWVTTPDVPWD